MPTTYNDLATTKREATESRAHQVSPPTLDSSSCNDREDVSSWRATRRFMREDSGAPTYPYNSPQRASARGLFLTVLSVLGTFFLSAASARYLFSRGRATRRENTNTNMISATGVVDEFSTRHTVDQVSIHATEICAGHAEWPVLNGADVVAYFSLEAGQEAVFGSPEHMSALNGYKFYFVSKENKDSFEERPSRYMPAWGGFCSWGISNEYRWTGDNLGPQADPHSWLITDDGVLHFFRSYTPRAKFLKSTARNVEKGNAVWTSWFGQEAPGVHGLGSPLNTACFCDVTTCEDG